MNGRYNNRPGHLFLGTCNWKQKNVILPLVDSVFNKNKGSFFGLSPHMLVSLLMLYYKRIPLSKQLFVQEF